MSDAYTEQARRNQTTILKALASVGQVRVAELTGTSESTVSRFKEAQLEQLACFLSACNLKVVGKDMKCFPEAKVQALLTLARDHLAQIEHPEQLVWE